MNYLVAKQPSDGRWQEVFKHYKELGPVGYVFRNLFLIVSNESIAFADVFINIVNSSSTYQYRIFAQPSTAPELLKQLRSQSARAFRLKTYLFNDTTTFLVYVRDASRPSAKYSYRVGKCVSNLDALYGQMNTNAAQGYRLFGPLSQGDFCQLYIKHTSRQSKFVYEVVSNPDTLEDFLPKANQFGARGYRHPSETAVELVSNGTSSYKTVPLYYRDTTQKGCTFAYSSAPIPDSISKVNDLLQKQGRKGFTFLRSFRQPPTRFAIFMKMTNCRYELLNIEDTY